MGNLSIMIKNSVCPLGSVCKWDFLRLCIDTIVVKLLAGRCKENIGIVNYLCKNDTAHVFLITPFQSDMFVVKLLDAHTHRMVYML